MDIEASKDLYKDIQEYFVGIENKYGLTKIRNPYLKYESLPLKGYEESLEYLQKVLPRKFNPSHTFDWKTKSGYFINRIIDGSRYRDSTLSPEEFLEYQEILARYAPGVFLKDIWVYKNSMVDYKALKIAVSANRLSSLDVWCSPDKTLTLARRKARVRKLIVANPERIVER